MAKIETSIDVDVPVHAAYNQWTQFESFPEFMAHVEEVRQIDDTRLKWKAKIAGKVTEWEAVITEQVPDDRIAWKSTEGAVNAGVVTFHRLDDSRTRVMLQLETEPQGVIETIGEAAGLSKRATEGDLERFKEFIENRGGESGAWRGEVSQPPTA